MWNFLTSAGKIRPSQTQLCYSKPLKQQHPIRSNPADRQVIHELWFFLTAVRGRLLLCWGRKRFNYGHFPGPSRNHCSDRANKAKQSRVREFLELLVCHGLDELLGGGRDVSLAVRNNGREIVLLGKWVPLQHWEAGLHPDFLLAVRSTGFREPWHVILPSNLRQLLHILPAEMPQNPAAVCIVHNSRSCCKSSWQLSTLSST